MIRRAHFELWTGLAGDMWVGACLDAGWPEERLREGVRALGIAELAVEIEERPQAGIVGKGIRVSPPEGHVHRHLADIREILDRSALPAPVKEGAGRVFTRLARAEARVHGTSVEAVHFHEVGALDAIADIALAVLAIHDLDVHLTAGPVPMTGGEVRMAHGTWPVPAPATALLLEGWPLRPDDAEGEFMTPTGAALLSELAVPSEVIPPMVLRSMGFGAGTREHPLRPNVVRLWIGESTGELSGTSETAFRGSPAEGATESSLAGSADESGAGGEPSFPREASIRAGMVIVLETQVDDIDPRWVAELERLLLEDGALDVFSEAVSMKKGRWGTRLTIISPPEREIALTDKLFAQSTTLGIRRRLEQRWELPRREEVVQTPWGEARVKWALRAGKWEGRFEADDILGMARTEQRSPADMESALDRWLYERRLSPGADGLIGPTSIS